MISIEQALGHCSPADVTPAIEPVAVRDALGRILAEAPVARVDLPRVDQSAMDGYVVRQEDVREGQPLPVTGVAAPGAPAPVLESGAAARIYTGARIPDGADTVVPQERVTLSGDTIVLEHSPEPGAHIRSRAEELRAGEVLAAPGRRITPGLLASLAMAGVSAVRVYRRPRVAVLITGDEVTEPGSELGADQVPDANGPQIRNVFRSWGYADVVPEYVSDRREAVRAALGDAMVHADLVVTTGGASVGDHDFIPGVATELGLEQSFWKVAQKPGKPLFLGRGPDTVLLGLPGNPAAVLVGMVLYGRRLLDNLSGCAQPGPAWYAGVLAASEAANAKRDRLVRMVAASGADGRVALSPLGGQASHMLGNLAEANALVWLPCAEQRYPAGEIVYWTQLPGTQLTAS